MIAFVAETDWWTWRRSAGAAGDAERAGRIGAPGLWRPDGRGEPGGLVFELPLGAVAGARRDEASAWAMATAHGDGVPEWKAPARATVAGWLGPGALAVRSGSAARSIEVVALEGRLALRVLLVAALDARLSRARRVWLRAVLDDALARTRFVRLGLASGDGPIVAEVDLSGAPAGLARPLITAAADALRWVAGSLLRTTEALADPELACDAFEIEPPRA